MNCKEAKILSIAHIMGDLDPDSEQYRHLESHLASCQVCAEEYKSSEWAIEFVEQHKTEFAGAFEAIDREKVAEQEEIQHSWKCLEARLDELEAQQRQEKQVKFHRLLVRVSAVAACLVIGASLFLVFSNYSKPKIAPKSTLQSVALAPKPSVRIELISKNSNILISANQQIISTNELKTLVINGKHRIVMNTNTVLAVEPLVENSNIGCLVKLVSGQIYTHVHHDRKPFIVGTAHGQAVITGTTFDIKATKNSTTLLVSEGTVQFESEQGTVNVRTGQKSEIVSQSAPSRPVFCNTAELTAWATGYEPEPALAQAELNTDPFELPLSLGGKPIVLEEIDYNHWIKEKQNWFRLQFPQIFQLQYALAKEGIQIDYSQLLVKTGDVWQFMHLNTIPVRFSVVNPNSLLKIASNYGFDKQWLLENVPAAKTAIEKPVLSENSFAGLKTFNGWLDYLDETKKLKPPTPIYSYHASKYLAETRSLVWFAVRDGKYDLTDKQRAEVMALLQEEVTLACKCQNDMLYPQDKQKMSCDNICQVLNDKIIGYIKAMKTVEERITKYEINQ
ncbi:FecR domain-containing protein [Planctomycetota bacterium]